MLIARNRSSSLTFSPVHNSERAFISYFVLRVARLASSKFASNQNKQNICISLLNTPLASPKYHEGLVLLRLENTDNTSIMQYYKIKRFVLLCKNRVTPYINEIQLT